MITKTEIRNYQGISYMRGEDYVYIPPHKVLRPFISCYTFSIPSDMSEDYTIIPSVSSTIVLAVGNHQIYSNLRAVNTKPCVVGKTSNKMKLLLLIEFRPGCLSQFVKIEQSELKDHSYSLMDINKNLMYLLESELEKATSVEYLVSALDGIFLSFLSDHGSINPVMPMMNMILTQHGNLTMGELVSNFYYSEKHIRRLFSQYVGTSPKLFSRIARVNYAIDFINKRQYNLTSIATQTGYFDQSHFINDFITICGVTPTDYINKMSVFYNDEIKYRL